MKAVVLGVVLVCIGVGILGVGLRDWSNDRRAASWPTTPATVTSSACVDYTDLENGWRFIAEVRYRYAVADVANQGDRISFAYAGSTWRGPCERIAARLAVGRTVTVHYDARTPSGASLAQGFSGATFRTLFVGAWFVLVALAIVRFGLRGEPADSAWSISLGASGLKTEGVGGIIVLALVGMAIATLVNRFVDVGILSTLVVT